MLNRLHEGGQDMARLNYGVISLIPKVKGPTNIRQYKPICLLNMICKILTKTLTLRLNKVAKRTPIVW